MNASQLTTGQRFIYRGVREVVRVQAIGVGRYAGKRVRVFLTDGTSLDFNADDNLTVAPI